MSCIWGWSADCAADGQMSSLSPVVGAIGAV